MVEHSPSHAPGPAPTWRVASPYFEGSTDQWLDRFIDPARLRFELVARIGEPTPWHERRSAKSTLRDWRNYIRQANRTLAQPSEGLIGIFPQVTATLAALVRAKRDDRPLVSWFFNTNLDSLLRRRAAGVSLSRVDRFVVHTTIEIDAYSRMLGIDDDRFRFVPLQYGGVIETERPPIDEPFIFATGSGFRDYGTFFGAVEKLGYRTLVLAGPRALADLTIPANVEVVDSMSRPEIRRHVRGARVNVVPMSTDGLTAGVVTVVETFRHGRGVVATRRSGLEDYLIHDRNSLLSSPRSVDELAEQIEAYWTDELLRHRIDTGATEFADTHCTDSAAADALTRILEEFTVAKQRSAEAA